MFKKNKNKGSVENAEPSLIDTIDITSVSKARKWVSTLPITDMGETTRRLFTALVKLNQGSIPPHVRTDVTEVLLPYVNMALENLDKHFLSRTYPLPTRSQKVFDLKKSMIMELAGSYQLAALDMLTKSAAPKKGLLISIGKAIHYMSLVIINDYSIYTKNKKNVWHDIHHLYFLACEQNIHNKKIPGKDADSVLNIEEQYKLINLIALVAPNTLRQNEVKRVKDFFSQIINDVKLISASKVTDKYAHVALLDRDEPASLMPIEELPISSTNRIFDLSLVMFQLDKFISLSETDDLGKNDKWPMLTHSLAKRLDHVLKTIHNRRFKRFDREEKASLVIRMADVLPMIRTNKPSEFMLGGEEDQEENIYDALAEEDKTESAFVLGNDDEETHRDVTIHSWNIENSSSGGYGLKQMDNKSTTARVGELTGIKDPKDTNGMWQIAVTRWMDSIKGVGLRIGLEVLSLNSLVVKVSEVRTRTINHKLPQEGILLPTVEGARDEAHLIFPNFIFKVDDEMVVTIGSREEHVRIISIDDTVGNFAYCSFEIIDIEETAEGSLESFDDVWEFI